MHLKFHIYDDFVKARKTWENFEKDAQKSPFQSFYWLYKWYETIGKNVYEIIPKIVVVRAGDNDVLLLPLGIVKKLNIKILTWLGGNQADYMGPLIHESFIYENYSFKSVWDDILSNIGKIDLVHFSNQLRFIGNYQNPLFDIMNFNLIDKSTQAILQSPWNDYYESMTKSKTRQTDRRKMKKLSSVSEVKFIVGKDQKTKKMILNKMIKQKRKRYRETNVWDMFSLEEYVQFYYNQLKEKENYVYKTHFSGLLVGETFVATHFGIISEDTFYFLMPGQDSGIYSKYSPGRLLILELLKWATENKFRVFDFTKGSESYKTHWSNCEMPIYESSQQLTISGSIYYKALIIFLKFKRSKLLQGKVKNIYLNLKYLNTSIGKK